MTIERHDPITKPCAGVDGEPCGTPTEVRPFTLGGERHDPKAQCADCEREEQRRQHEEWMREQDELRAQRRVEKQRYRAKTTGLPAASCCPLSELKDYAHQAHAVTAAERLIAGDLKGLVLRGSFGLGKTAIAASTAWELMLKQRIHWLRASDVTLRLGRPFDDPKRLEMLDAISDNTAGLVIDDLDKTRPTPWAAEPFFNAIDAAVNDERPLIVTMNMSLAEIAERWPDGWGEAIASRLAGYCKSCVLTGADLRLTA